MAEYRVSEMLYERTAKYYKYYDYKKLNKALKNDSKRYVDDVDNDALIDINDVLTFNIQSDKDRLGSLYRLKLPKVIESVHKGKIILLEIDNVWGRVDTDGWAGGVTISQDESKAYVADLANGLTIIGLNIFDE